MAMPNRKRKDYLLVHDGKLTEIASVKDTPPGEPSIHASMDKRDKRKGLWMDFELVFDEQPTKKPVK